MHEHWMRQAILIGYTGYTAPNPMVGCAIVRDDKLISLGSHEFAGGAHAEIDALAKAGPAAQGSDVYVTLEPCAHHGRTPPCADALIAAGVARVFVAVKDPGKGAGGIARLRAAGIEVHVGLLAEQAEAMNAVWLHQFRAGRPFVTLKVAMTVDGRIGPGIITNEASRMAGRKFRAQHGAVLVGTDTALQDNPELTVRDVVLPEPPIRIVLDPQRRLPGDLKIFSDGVAPTWRVVADESAQEGDIPIALIDGKLDLSAVLAKLTKAGVPGVLVEGGSKTHAEFIRQGLVDRLDLFIAPNCAGEGPRWEPGRLGGNLVLESRFELENVEAGSASPDVWLRYAVGR